MSYKRPHSYLPNEGLKLISYCPLCNARYSTMSAKILEEKEGAHLIHLECRNCGSSIVALIFTGGMGISSVGLVTDLTSEDVIKFKNAQDINSDDVIALHEFLGEEKKLVKELIKRV